MHIEKTKKRKLASTQQYNYMLVHTQELRGDKADIFTRVKQNELSTHTHTHAFS